MFGHDIYHGGAFHGCTRCFAIVTGVEHSGAMEFLSKLRCRPESRGTYRPGADNRLVLVHVPTPVTFQPGVWPLRVADR